MRTAVLIAVCAVALALAAVFERPVQQTQQDYTQSVVLIYSAVGEGHGSGVITTDPNGQVVILTAKHVAIHYEDPNGLLVRTIDNDQPRRVTGVVFDPNEDRAYLILDRPLDANEPPLPISGEPLKVGDAVTVIGTPYDRVLFDCILRGLVVKTGVDIPTLDERGLVIVDAHAGPGCSGGPVLDREGRVRGIVVVGVGNLTGVLPLRGSKGN